ncbi:diacylglycerol kinase [Parvibium lacunae]|uniref:Diacylglycerol kinase n=1 Tax=Parvibium lacunae TaxID=1888893 RepID=A0A368L7H1_9BURK|nr:diacylglycerol kinase [Parvibium lacunae]RCS59502.1 diacylglycerol kinase [Parvibium lacunae]
MKPLPPSPPNHPPAALTDNNSIDETGTESPFKGNIGIKRAYYALFHSCNGLMLAIRHESAFRQELTLAILLLPVALLLPVTAVERVLLIGSVILVLIVELLNSSVEAAIDRISLERHRLSKRAKDLGSAAVLLALALCLLTWGCLAGPICVSLLKNGL